MTFHKDVPYLKHILDSINDIEESVKNLSKKEFSNDKDKKEANIRRIEVIGEAVKNISIDFKNKYSNIPWKDIAGMRDKLIHHYFGVNVDNVWKVIKEDIPILKKEILKILEKEK
mgnify:CR=1 FL=1